MMLNIQLNDQIYKKVYLNVRLSITITLLRNIQFSYKKNNDFKFKIAQQNNQIIQTK